MMANTAFLAADLFLLLAWLAGADLPHAVRTALFRLHGVFIGEAALVVFLNLRGLLRARAVFFSARPAKRPMSTGN